jgi:primosomal protein N' (replication factor Y) (superfamily II helicase)
VQTMAPQAEAIRRAAAHDSAGFLEGELSRRRALRYPPFSQLIRVELSGADEAAVAEAAERLRAALRPGLPSGSELLGPAPRFRVRGRHRRQLLLKATERAPAVSAVRDVVESASAARELSGVALAVDVDPQ